MDDQERQKLVELVERLKQEDPKAAERFGDPTDENNPRNWAPSDRIERGMSLEDQVKHLSMDVEVQVMAQATLIRKVTDLTEQLDILQKWAAQKMADDLIEKVKADPQNAVKYMQEAMGVLGMQPTQKDVDELSSAIDRVPATTALAIDPDSEVQLVNGGTIKVREIPGYSSDPSWRPSDEWLDANCACAVHQEKRKQESTSYPTGMYL